jgi:UDP-N-acetylmuramyl pentapeptide synthase
MKSLHAELKRINSISRHFIKRKELQRLLFNNNYENSVILVKGSRGMKMEEFVKVIEDKISD